MIIPDYVWNDLRLDEGTRAQDAAMCFFVGKGVEETRRLLDGHNETELRGVRLLAPLSGFTAGKHGIRKRN